MPLDIRVTDGPGKWDLMVALFHGSEATGTRHKVRFQLEDWDRIEVQISSVERESDTGEDWNIRGYVASVVRGKARATNLSPNDRVSCYFSTASRKGIMRKVDN